VAASSGLKTGGGQRFPSAAAERWLAIGVVLTHVACVNCRAHLAVAREAFQRPPVLPGCLPICRSASAARRSPSPAGAAGADRGRASKKRGRLARRRARPVFSAVIPMRRQATSRGGEPGLLRSALFSYPPHPRDRPTAGLGHFPRSLPALVRSGTADLSAQRRTARRTPLIPATTRFLRAKDPDMIFRRVRFELRECGSRPFSSSPSARTHIAVLTTERRFCALQSVHALLHLVGS